MKEIRIGNTAIAYTVRENSKTERITINVTPGKVEVVVPSSAPDVVIEDFVYRKKRWIFEKKDEVDKAAQKLTLSRPTQFRTGAKILYRGRMMKIHINRENVKKIAIAYKNGFYITIPETMKDSDIFIGRQIESWMRKHLAQDCASFAVHYSKKLQLYPKDIRVKEQKHLWGSCSKDGIININWQLIFAPKQILEYVIAHEICHLRHRNHSEEFRRLLKTVFPEWEQCKTWLEKNEQVWNMSI